MNDVWQQQMMTRLDEVADSAARMDGWAEGITKRLDTINGSVGRHDKAIIRLRENQKIAFYVAAVLILEHFPQMAEAVKAFIK